MSLRRLLLAVATFAAGRKNKTQNTTLTIAFTSDLHGEITPLKYASTIYKKMSGLEQRGRLSATLPSNGTLGA